jgi:RNA polymerase sigma-70 factor (ECF subfamily)
VTQADDKELVASLKLGDARAFDKAYACYHPRIYSFLLRLCRSQWLADDLFQETWLSLAKNASSLRDDTNLIAWLLTVARNAWRSHQRWALVDLSRWLSADVDVDFALGTPDPENQAIVGTELAAVERAIGRLAPKYREVILLVCVEELESETVAEILDIRPDALRQRLSRARSALSDAMKSEGIEWGAQTIKEKP